MNTAVIKRFSPVSLPASVKERVNAGGWDVVLRYEDEGSRAVGRGSFSSKQMGYSKWIARYGPCFREVSAELSRPMRGDRGMAGQPNESQAGGYVGRSRREPGAPVQEHCATETTDGSCLLALIGENLQPIMEKLTSLDCFPPGKTAPYLVQGPVLHIPMQVVVLAPGVVLMAFSRGYGQAVADAIFGSCREFAIRPGGEIRFTEAIAGGGA